MYVKLNNMLCYNNNLINDHFLIDTNRKTATALAREICRNERRCPPRGPSHVQNVADSCLRIRCTVGTTIRTNDTKNEQYDRGGNYGARPTTENKHEMTSKTVIIETTRFSAPIFTVLHARRVWPCDRPAGQT